MAKKMTQQEFIERAKEIHGDKYDYSKVEYKNSSTKVCIICPEHGEFWQVPNSHLNGNGCRKCKYDEYKEKRSKTFEEFVNQAKEVHGDKYDYSKVEYKNNHTKVCIICPEHGEFWQTPKNHLNSQGCMKCKLKEQGKRLKYTTEKFIEKAKQVHGDIYDYSKVNYVDSHTKVCIICPEHGEFWQKPDNHLNGWGCKKCGLKISSEKRKLTKENFILKAREIHGWKYDYSKVEYVDNSTKVCIICPEHGEFWQTPNNHLNGYGCQLCGKNIVGEKLRKNIETFINDSREVHGDKYDYSKVKYKNNKIKVCIICPEHGEFWQTPNDHLDGCGCPSCNEYKLEKEIKDFLIENNINFESQKRFSWLGLQSLDFYLPDYNVGIECQGIQHFEPKDFFGGEKAFKEQVERDIKKYQKCLHNNIKLYYYSNINYNTEEIYTNKYSLLNKIKGVN